MRHDPLAVMLFAAGFGTRMGTLTQHQPKPLIHVAGKPLIDHALDIVRGADTGQIVVNLHYKAEMLADHLQGRGVRTVTEHPDILDTGGGLRNALPLLGDGPVITSNSDAIWAGANPITMLQEAWNPDLMDALLICVPVAQTIGRVGGGDFRVAPDGQLERGGDTVYGGIQILKTDVLYDVPEASFSLNLIWNKMAAAHRLYGLQYPGRWCDVGHPDGIAQAEALLADANV
ncbi:nucleotidyltransferase family protein [Tateyamaria sp.]|uniref:nucleotidyltransferase family protein n=1 Tax=Tateyamaria sp. TaxID=1929288 RepID=UPI003B224A18